MAEREIPPVEKRFRARHGHESTCNCVRDWYGRLIITRRRCDCKTGGHMAIANLPSAEKVRRLTRNQSPGAKAQIEKILSQDERGA